MTGVGRDPMLAVVRENRLPSFGFFEMLRTPLYRREQRAASGGGRLVVMLALAALLDATAVLGAVDRIQRALDGDRTGPPGESEMVAFAALIGVSLLLMLLAVGYAASGWAGEKERGTAEALVLTPLSRSFLVWTKLLARTRALRYFMLAAIPAFLAFGLIITADGLRPEAAGAEGGGYEERIIESLLGAVTIAALAWGGLTLQLHCIGVITLYTSARVENSFMAGVWGALIGVVLPLLLGTVLCCCASFVMPVYYLAVSVFMLVDMTNRLDMLLIGV